MKYNASAQSAPNPVYGSIYILYRNLNFDTVFYETQFPFKITIDTLIKYIQLILKSL